MTFYNMDGGKEKYINQIYFQGPAGVTLGALSRASRSTVLWLLRLLALSAPPWMGISESEL